MPVKGIDFKDDFLKEIDKYSKKKQLNFPNFVRLAIRELIEKVKLESKKKNI